LTLLKPIFELDLAFDSMMIPVLNIVVTVLQGLAVVLAPIIDLATSLVVGFTDLLSAILGGIPIMDIIKESFNALAFVVKIISTLILTSVGVLVAALSSAVWGIGKLISYIPGLGGVGASILAGGKEIAKAAIGMIDKGAEITGKEKKSKINPGSSVGAAVREVSSTSIAGVGDEIRKRALMAATGQKSQEESLADIAKALDKNTLRDAFKDGMIAANNVNKGDAGIKGKDPYASQPKGKPLGQPV